MSIEAYLKEQGLKYRTITQHTIYINQFITYTDISSLTISQVTYAEILEYVELLNSQDKSISLINHMLLALRYYFTNLQSEGQVKHNPAAGITIKGIVRGIPLGSASAIRTIIILSLRVV